MATMNGPQAASPRSGAARALCPTPGVVGDPGGSAGSGAVEDPGVAVVKMVDFSRMTAVSLS